MSQHEDQEIMLTTEEAFAAMFEFLNSYWREFKTANVADVLSDAHPAYGGQSSDPAVWEQWLQAVAIVHARTTGGS